MSQYPYPVNNTTVPSGGGVGPPGHHGNTMYSSPQVPLGTVTNQLDGMRIGNDNRY